MFERCCWLTQCRPRTSPNPGSFVTFDIGPESVYHRPHAPEGESYAFYNVCQHRGRRLVEATLRALSQRVRCKYHAWTYRLDGSVRTPSLDP